jgi:hypothetical protein
MPCANFPPPAPPEAGQAADQIMGCATCFYKRWTLPGSPTWWYGTTPSGSNVYRRRFPRFQRPDPTASRHAAAGSNVYRRILSRHINDPPSAPPRAGLTADQIMGAQRVSIKVGSTAGGSPTRWCGTTRSRSNVYRKRFPPSKRPHRGAARPHRFAARSSGVAHFVPTKSPKSIKKIPSNL